MGAQVRIANTLEQFYDESTPIGPSGQRYKDAVTKMESQAISEVVRSYLSLLDTDGICHLNKDLQLKNRKGHILSGDLARFSLTVTISQPLPLNRMLRIGPPYWNPLDVTTHTFPRSMRRSVAGTRNTSSTTMPNPRSASWSSAPLRMLRSCLRQSTRPTLHGICTRL